MARTNHNARTNGSLNKHGPLPISELVAEVISRRGIGRTQSLGVRDAAWRAALGEALAKQTRPGAVRRGTLEVIVANSTLLQELTFQKTEILKRLTQHAPELAVQSIRFRVGPIPSDQ
jgi:predicted nucleic acid-binding Zn ribbon protein